MEGAPSKKHCSRYSTHGEAYGFPFEEKKEYLVYVAPGLSSIETGICTGTKSFVGAEQEIEQLDRLVRESSQ